MDTLAGLDATEQAELVANGVLTPDDLLDAASARIALVEPLIHSIVNLDIRRGARVKGPFGGVPFLIKDSTPYPGLPWTFGTRLLRKNTMVPHTPLAKRIDEAGLVVIGKSATSELGLLASTETLAFGVTHNPWDLSRSAAGSSGGAAAAVAAGIVPLAHANDGGGSIRIPASVCGVFGFKPSRGRTVASGLGSSDFAEMTSDGCVSRTVRDAAKFISAISEQAFVVPSKRRLRIGAFTRTYDGREPVAAVRAAHDATIQLLTDLGHRVEEVTPPQLDLETLGEAFFLVAGAAVAALVKMFGRVRRDGLEPFTWALHDRYVAKGTLDASRDVLASAARAHLAMLQGFDALLSPVVATLPWPIGHLSPLVPADELIKRTAEIVAYTPLQNIAGCPAMSVPLHASNGLPIGAHISAAPGEDALLFALAYELEEAKPWTSRIPIVSALRTPD